MTRNHQTLELVIRCTECGSIYLSDLDRIPLFPEFNIGYPNTTMDDFLDQLEKEVCLACDDDSIYDDDESA